MPIESVMHRDHKARSGLALGGIGAGWFEIRKDGCFYNWNIWNNQPLFSGPRLPFPAETSVLWFLVRYQEQGEEPRSKVLAIEDGVEIAGLGSPVVSDPWMSGVEEIQSSLSFPFARLEFRDQDMPFTVEMEAFSSFIPGDVKNSSLPAAFFRFRLLPKSKRPVKVMLVASMRSGVGYDVVDKKHTARVLRSPGTLICERGAQMDPTASSAGTQALVSLGRDSSYYLGWEHRHPYYEKLINAERLGDVDDTEGRNPVDKQSGKVRGMRLFDSVAGSTTLKGKAWEHRFALAWHFPNLYPDVTAHGKAQGLQPDRSRTEGHYYERDFADAAAVARHVVKGWNRLEAATRAFHDEFYDSSLPPFVLEQVNSHLNTFFTSTWLSRTGDFGVQEGLTPLRAYGPLATVDVAAYASPVTLGLFPELEKSMLLVHQRMQSKEGAICHGIGRDFHKEDAEEAVSGRIDLPGQYVIQAVRYALRCGDNEYLDQAWASLEAAMDFVLRTRDEDGDGLPDMHGSHSSYDNIPMWGAASFPASFFLAAAEAMVHAARKTGRTDSAQRWSAVLEKGAATYERKLWNGSFYRLWNDQEGKHGGSEDGCLRDQILGVWCNQFLGLGRFLPAGRVRPLLQTIFQHTHRPGIGTINCAYPDEGWFHEIRPEVWADQYNICWSGGELVFAAFLLMNGLHREALTVVRQVDDTYRRAGLYFDHKEFGGHYYRPMGSWALLEAALGFSAQADELRFHPQMPGMEQNLFFALTGATARYRRTARKGRTVITLSALSGEVRFRTLVFAGQSPKLGRALVTGPGPAPRAEVLKGMVVLSWPSTRRLRAGESLSVELRTLD